MTPSHPDALGAQQLGLLTLPSRREPSRGVDHTMCGNAPSAPGECAAHRAGALGASQPIRDAAVAGHAAGRDGTHQRRHLLLEGRRLFDDPESRRDLHGPMVDSRMTPRDGGQP